MHLFFMQPCVTIVSRIITLQVDAIPTRRMIRQRRKEDYRTGIVSLVVNQGAKMDVVSEMKMLPLVWNVQRSYLKGKNADTKRTKQLLQKK